MRYVLRGAPVLALIALLVGAFQLVQPREAQAQVASIRIGIVDSDSAFDRREYTTANDPTRDNTVQVIDADQDTAITLTSLSSGSSSDTWDCELVLTETGADSGVFRGTFRISDDADDETAPDGITGVTTCTAAAQAAGTVILLAADGDDITAEYLDSSSSQVRRRSIEIEIDAPDITNLSPGDGTVVDDEEFDVSARFKDDDAGVEQSTLVFLVSTLQRTNDDIFQDADSAVDADDSGDATDDGDGLPRTIASLVAAGLVVEFIPDAEEGISDIEEASVVVGYDADVEVVVSVSSGYGEIFVTAAAVDEAGNLSILDTDSDDFDVVFAKYIVDTNEPDLLAAYTGIKLDDDADPVALETNERNWIQVIFTDTTNLDGTSVDEEDFTVDGHTVKEAAWFDEDAVDLDGDGTIDDDETIRKMVFLRLSGELDADEEPDVFIIPGSGGIADEAGNAESSESVGSIDRIGPAFTLDDISLDLAGSGDEVVLTISSDEGLDGDEPTLTVESVETEGDTLDTSINRVGLTNVWTVTIEEPAQSTIYNIYISGDDDAANSGDLGIADVDDVIGDDGVDGDAITFEADLDLFDPLTSPASGDTDTFRNPFFITVDFGASASDESSEAEGSEYDEDGHGDVTITSAELNGDDVLASASSVDGSKWLIAVSGIAIGEHELVIAAEDDAGNQFEDNAFTLEFEVAERGDFSIALNPGWNLVSFPADPSDSDIDAVIGDTPVTTVYSYDPSLPGGWLVAIREEQADGTFTSFTGSLDSIVSTRGYWVETASFKGLEVEIPALAGGAGAGSTPVYPPTLSLAVGWNLVPILDVTGDLGAGDIIDSDVYFTGLESAIARIYTYATVTNAWQIVVRDGERDSGTQAELTAALSDAERLEVGRAYWVYMNEPGVLVP